MASLDELSGDAPERVVRIVVVIHSDATLQLHNGSVMLTALLTDVSFRHLLQEAGVLANERVAEHEQLRRYQMDVRIEATSDAAEKLLDLLHYLQCLSLVHDLADWEKEAADLWRGDVLGQKSE